MRNLSAGFGIGLAMLALGVSPAWAGEWAHWRGPERNDLSPEPSGWSEADAANWLAAEPAWRIEVGAGASAPIVAGGKLYAIGWADDRDTVRCLDAATGASIWEQGYAAPEYGRQSTGDKGFYRGATATPEFDAESGLLFTLSCDGALNAWDTRGGGGNVWALNLHERFGVPRRPQITKRKNTLRDYGYTTAPLVWGDWIVVEAGDPERGCLMAFDKRKGGDPVWTSENRDPAGHSGGLVPMTVEGVPCVAVATSWNALVVRLDGANAGKTVAEFEWKTDFSNTIAGVTVSGSDLLIASRYNQMAMARVAVSLKGGAREVWRNRYPTGVCAPLVHEGRIYFANKGVHCVDFASGDLVWEGGKIGDAGSCLMTSDSRLIVWGNAGDLSLVEGAGRSPDRCHVLAERIGVFKDMAWPHVVLADGRIYCKSLKGDLACFAIGSR
ncbi:MAG: PQQ-binding-like beta-propeller repeat protein [Verrucomicrobiae bacterium]|nr:PQQ-binding-like beta-propeller repeat protein [Verrucomicrobiae bacterium]